MQKKNLFSYKLVFVSGSLDPGGDGGTSGGGSE